MSDYTHLIVDNEGFTWGAFPNKNIANVMKNCLELKFPIAIFFVVEIQ